MKMQTRGSGWARWLGALALLAVAGPALALNNWELGKDQFAAECASCHNLPNVFGGGKQNFPAGQSATTVQGKINDGMRGLPDPLATASDAIIHDTVSNIAAYLSKTTFPLAALAPSSVAFTAVSVDLTRTQTFRLTNSGDAALIVSGIAVSDSTNYSVPAGACASVAVGSFCDFDVTFAPKSANTFNNRTLTVSHNTFAASSTATLSGTGLVQFSVAPTSLSFTAATAPAGVLQATVTDNKGDRIRICRADAATFNFPADFTLDAPFTLGGDGCFTTAVSASLPRSLALNVRFTPGAAGPRNGALTIRRVDAGGATLGSTTTIQLQGNPGALATVNRSSLFDAVADPGVEVENDNVLERTVTLFSQGSQPLVFDGSSFTISGPGSGEYTLTGGGCQALAGLPASTGGTPPSCDLTVRFNPSDIGRRGPATLTIQSAGANSNSVLLNGLGIRGPRLAVRRGTALLASGDVVQFGTQSVGGLYAPVALTLSNGGTVGDLEVQLPAAGSVPGFTFAAGAGCATLAPAASCTVEVRFEPTAAQAYASPLAISTRPAGSGAAFAMLTLDLRGQGAAGAVPVLTWTDTTGTPISRLDFADTQLGTPRTNRIRLYNGGPGGVTLQFSNVVGVGGSNFVLDAADCAAGQTLFEKHELRDRGAVRPGDARRQDRVRADRGWQRRGSPRRAAAPRQRHGDRQRHARRPAAVVGFGRLRRHGGRLRHGACRAEAVERRQPQPGGDGPADRRAVHDAGQDLRQRAVRAGARYRLHADPVVPAVEPRHLRRHAARHERQRPGGPRGRAERQRRSGGRRERRRLQHRLGHLAAGPDALAAGPARRRHARAQAPATRRQNPP
jgi:hypothetical protein